MLPTYAQAKDRLGNVSVCGLNRAFHCTYREGMELIERWEKLGLITFNTQRQGPLDPFWKEVENVKKPVVFTCPCGREHRLMVDVERPGRKTRALAGQLELAPERQLEASNLFKGIE